MTLRKMETIDDLRKKGYPPLKSKYPAKEHCKRVADNLRAAGFSEHGIIYLESQKTIMIEDSDMPQTFRFAPSTLPPVLPLTPSRQRRPFYYLSGCDLPDSYLIYSISTHSLTLLIPPISPSEVVWNGLPLSPTQALAKYDCDRVLTCPDLIPTLESLARYPTPTTVFAIPEQATCRPTLGLFPSTNYTALKRTITTERITKDLYEACLIARANDISATAHAAVRAAAPSASSEAQLLGTFVGTCIAHGGANQAYPPIVASGTHAATLHYVANDAALSPSRLNILLDAGAEFHNYASDVTRTFPVNGTFSTESRAIHAIVQAMQDTCLAQLKAGVDWDAVHVAAHIVAIKGLKELGLLKGEVDELFENRVSTAFFPHGLGHYLGLDTHDVGGVVDYADPDLMFRYLRVRGEVPLASVVTVEPGVSDGISPFPTFFFPFRSNADLAFFQIYFCPSLIKPYLQNPNLKHFFDENVLERYWEVGGVRIEDNVWLTRDGYENLTSASKEME